MVKPSMPLASYLKFSAVDQVFLHMCSSYLTKMLLAHFFLFKSAKCLYICVEIRCSVTAVIVELFFYKVKINNLLCCGLSRSVAAKCYISQCRHNSNRAAVTRVHRHNFPLLYPTMVVLPDGSTINIRYKEPRSIIRVATIPTLI